MQNIIFMGTPDFAVPILKALNEEDEYRIQAVVTQPDRKVGRKKKVTPPPVKQYAEAAGLLVLQPEKISGSDEMNRLIAMQPDLIITAAYGQFLPKELLDAPKFGSINVHASLLPKYRGAAPIHYAVMSGDPETGVSIIYMDEKMDAGDILRKRSIPIEAEDNTGTLFEKLSFVGRDLLKDVLPDLFSGIITSEKQEESLVTYSPMITPEQEELDWNRTAEELSNKIRGLYPFPGSYTFLNGERFKIWKAEVADEKTDEEPGTIIKAGKKELYTACGKGTVLSLETVQPAGKGKMPVSNYLAGAKLEKGIQFGK